eukprot:4103881-Pyramimonas_sp.AAC.1
MAVLTTANGWVLRQENFRCFWLLAFSGFERSKNAEEAPKTAPRPPKRPSGRPRDGPRRLQ